MSKSPIQNIASSRPRPAIPRRYAVPKMKFVHAILVSPQAFGNDDSDNARMIVDNDAKLRTMHHILYVKAK